CVASGAQCSGGFGAVRRVRAGRAGEAGGGGGGPGRFGSLRSGGLHPLARGRLMPVIDPHCHTTASDGMVTPAELVAAAVKAGLNAIAVTDHDTMRSVKETQERGEAFGLQVVGGQEITTKWPAQTHILAWFLDEPVKRGMSVDDTVRAIHDQGGLAIIPHPFMPVYFGSMQPRM